MEKLLSGQVVRSGLVPKIRKVGLRWLKGNPLRKLHKSINKRQRSLILITLEHIEYLQVTEVTKGYLSRISEGR
jgi:hypothetical protein